MLEKLDRVDLKLDQILGFFNFLRPIRIIQSYKTFFQKASFLLETHQKLDNIIPGHKIP